MLAPSNSKFGPMGVKEFEVFDLPFILPNLAALRKVTEGPLGAELLKLLEPKGMIGLAYWDNGFKQMSANKPLRDAGGLQGPEVPHPVLEGAGSPDSALGAIPQVMAFSEVYQALQTGVVDGQENTPSNIYTQKMHEVQKYTTLTNHGYIGYVVVVNKKFWDGLPADVRAKLDKAMKEATAYANGQSQKENDEALADDQEAGKTELITLTPPTGAAMRKAMEPIYEDMAGRVGQQLIDDVRQDRQRCDQSRQTSLGRNRRSSFLSERGDLRRRRPGERAVRSGGRHVLVVPSVIIVVTAVGRVSSLSARGFCVSSHPRPAGGNADRRR